MRRSTLPSPRLSARQRRRRSRRWSSASASGVRFRIDVERPCRQSMLRHRRRRCRFVARCSGAQARRSLGMALGRSVARCHRPASVAASTSISAAAVASCDQARRGAPPSATPAAPPLPIDRHREAHRAASPPGRRRRSSRRCTEGRSPERVAWSPTSSQRDDRHPDTASERGDVPYVSPRRSRRAERCRRSGERRPSAEASPTDRPSSARPRAIETRPSRRLPRRLSCLTSCDHGNPALFRKTHSTVRTPKKSDERPRVVPERGLLGPTRSIVFDFSEAGKAVGLASAKTWPPVAAARRSRGSRAAASSTRSGVSRATTSSGASAVGSSRGRAGGRRGGQVRACGRGGATASKVRGWPARGPQRDDGHGLAGGLAVGAGLEDAGGDQQVGADARDVLGEPGLELAPSPSAPAGRAGRTGRGGCPRRACRSRPAHDLAPEPVVVGVADPVPPAPGAVGADPEDLAQPVGLGGDRGGGLVGRVGERRQDASPAAWPCRRRPRGAGAAPPRSSRLALGLGGEAGASASASAAAEAGGHERHAGGQAGCAGSVASGRRRGPGVEHRQELAGRLAGRPAPPRTAGRGRGRASRRARRRRLRAGPRPRRARSSGSTSPRTIDVERPQRVGRPSFGRGVGPGRQGRLVGRLADAESSAGGRRRPRP